MYLRVQFPYLTNRLKLLKNCEENRKDRVNETPNSFFLIFLMVWPFIFGVNHIG